MNLLNSFGSTLNRQSRMALDAVGKRKLAFSLAVLLQAIKIYYWSQQRDANTFYFLVKWLLLESVALGLLKWSRVPRLHFSILMSVIFAVLLLLINVLVFAILPHGINTVRIHYMPASKTMEMAGLEADFVDEIAGSKERFLDRKLFWVDSWYL